MEAQGVEIRTCGTCLDYYKLKETWPWAASPICTPLWRRWPLPESHQAMIYLDNAATTRQKPQPVIDAVVSAMTTLGNSARGTHEGSLSASRMIYGTREKLATFFNCPRPDHVVLHPTPPEALNMAICGLLNPGDHVIATDLEHNSVLRPCTGWRRSGACLQLCPG